MDIAALEFIEGLVVRVGLPIAVSVVFIYIVLDAYFAFKKELLSNSKKQADNTESIANTAADELKIIEVMHDEQATHQKEVHEYILEARIKCPWLIKPDWNPGSEGGSK